MATSNPKTPRMRTGVCLGVLKTGMLAGMAAILLSACATGFRPLSETLYEGPEYTDFDDLPADLKTPETRFMFITDRLWEEDSEGEESYTYKRSRSMEFGYAMLDIGGDMGWEDLTAWTLGEKGDEGIEAPVFQGVVRKGAFPETPAPFFKDDSGAAVPHPDWQQRHDAAASALQDEIRAQLAIAPVKEVILGVHGIQTSLEETTRDFSLWWHMGGRQRVPISYSWPAGKKGAVSFYVYDRESGEFTNFHLKQALRIIAAIPELEGIHVVGHSRGTDIALTALRELIIEERAAGRDPRSTLKLKNLVLMSADLDFDVVSQRFEAEALWTAFDRVTAYATSEDSVLSSARFFFASTARIGELAPEDMPESYWSEEWSERNVDIIFYEGDFKGSGVSSHTYYLSPTMGADLILLIRGHPPGKEHGRPLKHVGGAMYSMSADYLQRESE